MASKACTRGDGQLALELTQRWNRQRYRFKPAGERINPSLYGVEVIGDAAAAAFIAQHHYARTSPPAILSVGLFETKPFSRSHLVGVCRFSVPMSQRAVPAHTGQKPEHGCELGRLVLLDDVPGNGESFFVARAFRLLVAEKPRLRSVISYSDPVPRTALDGRALLKGHVGTVYQALNAKYLGRSTPRTLVLAPDGSVISARTLSKIRNDERGAGYAYRQLVSAGADRIRQGESSSDYVDRVLRSPVFRRLRHGGNHTYAWGLGEYRAEVEAFIGAGAEYPKRSAA